MRIRHDHGMRDVVRRPPADGMVDALVRAGVSRQTALAMQRHKAEEILDLLDSVRFPGDGSANEAGSGLERGTI